jgi:hypothetical protein
MSGSYNKESGEAIIKGNLGDMMSFHVIDFLIREMNLNINIIPINQKTPLEFVDGVVICLIGSIINHIPKLKKFKEVYVIGCGNINGDKIKSFPNIKVIGVRGPDTKLSLIENKDVKVISDPGLLISEVFKCENLPTKKIGYIIHSVDRETFFNNYPELFPFLIDNYKSPEKFVNQLHEYEYIISSSLHGIIFSHSYGKKVLPIKITDKIIGGDYKFKDYFNSLGIQIGSRFSFSFKKEDENELLKIFEQRLFPEKYLIEKVKKIQLNEITEFLKLI